jgi:hypothetical protein
MVRYKKQVLNLGRAVLMRLSQRGRSDEAFDEATRFGVCACVAGIERSIESTKPKWMRFTAKTRVVRVERFSARPQRSGGEHYDGGSQKGGVIGLHCSERLRGQQGDLLLERKGRPGVGVPRASDLLQTLAVGLPVRTGVV